VKTLLDFYVRYFDFLYLDPRYHITDSTTSGDPTINASLRLTGPVVSWELSNDRGQTGIAIAPTRLAKSPDNWFRISLVRQYLDNYDETNVVTPEATVAWIRDNLNRLEALFSNANAARACEELLALAKLLATRYFGPPT
jgi:hypothetical protein